MTEPARPLHPNLAGLEVVASDHLSEAAPARPVPLPGGRVLVSRRALNALRSNLPVQE